MANDQTKADKEFERVANEVREGHLRIFAEARAGKVDPLEHKARKKALALKEREMKQMLAEAKKAARQAKPME